MLIAISSHSHEFNACTYMSCQKLDYLRSMYRTCVCCITRRWNLYAMLPQFSVFFSAAVLKIFGMKDVPLELLPVGQYVTDACTIILASYYSCLLLHVLVDSEKLVQFNKYPFVISICQECLA